MLAKDFHELLMGNDVEAIQGCQTEQTLHDIVTVLMFSQHCSGCPTASTLLQLLDNYEICVLSDAMPLFIVCTTMHLLNTATNNTKVAVTNRLHGNHDSILWVALLI